MSIVAAHGIQKAYGPDVVLRSADVIIDPGQRVGMVGKNGAGKSTLARIIAGTESPDAGQVARRRGALILHLDQVPRFEGDPTAREGAAQGLAAWNAAMAAHEALSARLGEGGADLERLLAEQARVSEEIERLGGFDQAHRVAAMLGHLGIRDIDRRLSTLSGGEQRRVALARALIARADLTILDEPTNHLDAETVEWLEQYLIDEHTGAVLLITHDRYLLDRVAERTLEVADGEVFSYDGGYELYLEQKAERMAHAARTEQNRQNFVRRELEWLRRQPKARTTKQKARIDRAEAAIAVQAPKAEQAHSFELDVARSGKTILETRALAVEINGRTLVKNLEMFLTEGDRIGVVGANGIGKTTLLKTLLGEREPSGGKVVLGQNTKVAYFDQQRSGLENDKSIFENIGTDQSRIQIGSEVMEPRTYLERFGFDSHKQRQPVGSLSGGERARVALARMLRQSANLVVMDEPTNDLDVSTLGALESMLVELGATALVVTHDRWFLDRVATAILAFEGDGRVALYPGNYESFRRLSAEARAQRASQPSATSEKARAESAPPKPGAKKKAALNRAEEKELAAAPDAIERAEQQVSSLEQKLADPSTYSASGTDVPRLVAELDAAKAEVARLMARWEELEAKKSG